MENLMKSVSPPSASFQSQDIVMLRDVYKSFGDNEVLKGVSFSVKRGQVTVLIGKSGSGKSTALRCIDRLDLSLRIPKPAMHDRQRIRCKARR